MATMLPILEEMLLVTVRMLLFLVTMLTCIVTGHSKCLLLGYATGSNPLLSSSEKLNTKEDNPRSYLDQECVALCFVLGQSTRYYAASGTDIGSCQVCES